MLQAHVVIAPGLEAALAEELQSLGLSATPSEGAVKVKCGPEGLWAIHLYSRLAGRVTVQIAKIRSGALAQMAAAIRKLPWKRYVHPGQPIAVKVMGKARRDTVAKKAELAIRDALRGPRKPGGRPPREPVGVGLVLGRDHVLVTVDASGELLHRRGWRRQTAKAPIRENLGAAMLWLAEWEPDEPLVDPMCGSGTIPIEAACIAAGRVPGGWRSFAFERWPCHDPRAYAKMKREAVAGQTGGGPILLASDRDQGAVNATRSNAKRAGVSLDVRASEFGELEPPAAAGLLCMNPPYGARIGGDYGAIGRILRQNWSGWRFALLVPRRQLLGKLGMKTEEAATFSNGGIRVHLVVGEVPAG